MNKKIYPVLDASSAISDHNEKVTKFGEIQSRLRKLDNNLVPLDESGEPTLDEYMMTNGIPVSFSTKQALAKKIGLHNYDGSSKQDRIMLNALGAQSEKKGAEDKQKADQGNKEKEHGFKEKELQLKEKEIDAKKLPDADAIAESLMKKFNE